MSEAQLPLALRLAESSGFDDFIPADSPTVCALRGWLDADAANASDPLLLVGPRATGKSHLLLACAAELARRGEAPGYLPLATLASDAAAMIAAQPAAAAVLIDDLQQMVGEPALQLALFGLHNRQRDVGGRLLYAARESPVDWPQLLPDLRSRLGQCTRLFLSPLDEPQRRDWLALQARRRGFTLDAAAIEYVFRRAGRDLPGLQLLLDRLDRRSLAAQRRVTVPFLREVLQTTLPAGAESDPQSTRAAPAPGPHSAE